MIEEPKQVSDLFAQYLGAKANDSLLELRYHKAIRVLALADTIKEQALLNKLVKYPFLLPIVDAGLALLNSSHTVRRRIVVMSALMETDTRYTHLFLKTQNSRYPVSSFIYRISVASLKALAGVLLLKIAGWV